MKASAYSAWIRFTAVVALGAGAVAAHSEAPLSAHPIAVAIKRGDCDTAIGLVKKGVQSGEEQAVFLGGRMLDEGVCVQQDHVAAARFYELAAGGGDRDASLEYASKVGLGEGSEQSYERAGEICRAAGFDPQKRLSGYSLGYACTVRGVASRIIRVTLPLGAFRAGSGEALVEFSPANSQLEVRSTPQVARDLDAATGSNLGHHRVNAKRVIEDGWQKAQSAVPKPDIARLDGKPVELSLDINTPIEGGELPDRTLDDQELHVPFSADLRRIGKGAAGG